MGKNKKKKQKQKRAQDDGTVKKRPVAAEVPAEGLLAIPSEKPGMFSRPLLHLLLIVLVAVFAYSNTFDVPFHWDGKVRIADNPIIKDLDHFSSPSKAKWMYSIDDYRKNYEHFRDRYVSYLSFALNYAAHELDVGGYHAVNLTIHILNALLVYLFILITFRTPYLRSSPLAGDRARTVALIAALLFVSHPVQTEAVTYIYQRTTALVTFFYLGCLVSYVASRLCTGRKSYMLYALSIAAAVLAMKTKENAFTLPMMVALYEFMFLTGPAKGRLLKLTPILLTMLIIPLTLLSSTVPAQAKLEKVDYVFRRHYSMPRFQYLFNEFNVIVTYLRLLVLPVGQRSDYDYPVYDSFFSARVMGSFALLVSLAALGVYLYKRSKSSDPSLKLVSFGIFWFFIALAVESSLVPINMLINEYRSYLPSVGALSAVSVSAVILLGRVKNEKAYKAAIGAALLVPLVLAGTTYARNNVWKTRIGLWQDTVNKSPGLDRAHHNLGYSYYEIGELDKAIESYEKARAIDPRNSALLVNMGIAYGDKGLGEEAEKLYKASLGLDSRNIEALINLGAVFASKGETDKSIKLYERAIMLKPDAAEAYVNLGNSYLSGGMPDEAIKYFEKALKYVPEDAEVHNNLGNVYESKGFVEIAEKHYAKALKADPENSLAHLNIGAVYHSRGENGKALEHYFSSLAADPDFADAHVNIGTVYLAMGETEKAVKHLKKAIALNPNDAGSHNDLGNAYMSTGNMNGAGEHFKEAVRLDPSLPEAQYNLGVYYAKTGRNYQAISAFETALALKPELEPARRALIMLKRMMR